MPMQPREVRHAVILDGVQHPVRVELRPDESDGEGVLRAVVELAETRFPDGRPRPTRLTAGEHQLVKLGADRFVTRMTGRPW